MNKSLTSSLSVADVLSAEDDRYEAQIEGDIEALDRLLGKDLIYFHSSTIKDTKDSFITAIETEKLIYEEMERFDSRVRIYGDIAVITGRAQFKVVSRGRQKNLDMLFHAIWIMRDQRLQFISWQATPMPD